MPRDNDKNNDSRGRRDRPGDGKGRAGAARAAQARRGGRRRNSPSAGLPARGTVTSATASGVPMPGSPTARSRLARSLIPAVENLTPASATATIVRRAGTLATRRARAAIGRLLAVRHAVTMVKSVRSSRVKIVAVATSARSSRAATVRISIATTVRRAGIAAPDRDDARPAGRSSDRKFGDKKPYTPREGGGEKRPYTPRGEGFRKDGDRPRGDRPFSARPSRDGDRPRGDRPERKFGGDKKFSRGAPDRGPRKNFGEPTAAIQSRGRSARIAASAIPVPPVTARAISTSRALTGRATTVAARSVRAFRVRARIARNSIVRVNADRDGDPGRPEGRTDWQEHPRSEAR